MSQTIVRVNEDLEDLIPGFFENRRKDIGHGLKGVGGSYGFDMVSNLGRQMEQAARTKNAGEIRRLIAELKDYLAKVKVVFVQSEEE